MNCFESFSKVLDEEVLKKLNLVLYITPRFVIKGMLIRLSRKQVMVAPTSGMKSARTYFHLEFCSFGPFVPDSRVSRSRQQDYSASYTPLTCKQSGKQLSRWNY